MTPGLKCWPSSQSMKAASGTGRAAVGRAQFVTTILHTILSYFVTKRYCNVTNKYYK